MEKKGQLQKSLDEGANQIDRAVNESVGLNSQSKPSAKLIKRVPLASSERFEKGF